MEGGEQMKIKNKVGRFELDDRIIIENPAAARAIMGEVAIVRCEHLFHKAAFEYMGFSEHFREIPPGEEPPFYNVMTVKGDKGYTVIFQRREGIK
jgi:hypothetical protein